MVRRLTPDEADAFTELRLLGLERHPEAFGTGAGAWRAASGEQTRAPLMAEEPMSRFVLGAFDGDVLVGILGFRREGRTSVRHKGSLWGLFVHPDHRRRGHGRRLVGAALDELRGAEGMRYVRLVVTTSSKEAIELFESCGFVRYGLEAQGLCVKDRYFDQAFMRRELGQLPPPLL